MSLEAVFMRCGNLRKQCEARDTAGNTHIIEPYAIYTSAKHRRCFYYYLVSSSTPDSQPGWRTDEARSFTSGKMLDQPFAPRQDYDPFDKNVFPFIHYSIPTHDGRQRWMDKSKEDKNAEKLRAEF